MKWAISVFFLGQLLVSVPAFAAPLTLEVTEAATAYDARSNLPLVTVRLSDASRKAFAEFSTRHVGKKVDFRVGGSSVMTPVIREPITGGSVQISVASEADARQIAERLKSKTPLDVEVVP